VQRCEEGVRMAEDIGEYFKAFGIVCLASIALYGLIEVGLLIYAYATADEIHCSWWGCEFTTIRTSSNTTISSTRSESCYRNGIQVNCSDMPVVDGFGDD
jgi:hypothetical protein